MSQKGKFSNWLKTSITARMLVVGLLIVALLLPLSFVQSLIYERSFRQQEVVAEINNKWGEAVVFSGPILQIPYKTYITEQVYDQATKETSSVTRTVVKKVFFLPATLDYKAQVTTKPLQRSIYETAVYSSEITTSGKFADIDFSLFDISAENVLWDKATLLLKTSNLKGIKSNLEIQLDDQVLAVSPIHSSSLMHSIESQPIKDLQQLTEAAIEFNFSFKINGSESLQFVPLGKDTKAAVISNWDSPSFNGHFLPNDETKEISANGFKADWTIPQLSRKFEQQFLNSLPDLSEAAFGVKLVIPVDHYTQSERSSKYGFLVIGLTLLVFLLIQIVSKIYIHPFQYLLIGLALVLFYTLLVSISEHQNFNMAYLISGTATVGLVSLFATAVLKSVKFGLLILGSMSALYGFIFTIIQLESYALLVGSVGLFLILAIIMFVTRKIDWSNES